MFEKLVVEHRPEKVAHPLDRAVDQVGLVDAIYQHDDSRVAERPQQRLELVEHLVTVVAAVLVGDRLIEELAPLETREELAQQVRMMLDDAHLPRDAPRLPEQPAL